MLNKNINKHLNEMKFYIFEQAVFNKIEKRIEQCIKELNIIQNEDEQILKYRYGLEGCGWSSQDFIIEFYYDKWIFEANSWGSSWYKPQVKLTISGLYKRIEKEKEKILYKYFGDGELVLYRNMLKTVFSIRADCGKDYKWMKERYLSKTGWKNY